MKNCFISYFTISKNYFINYTITFYNTPNISIFIFLFYSLKLYIYIYIPIQLSLSLLPHLSSTLSIKIYYNFYNCVIIPSYISDGIVALLHNCNKNLQFQHFTSPVANIFLYLDCTFPLHFLFAIANGNALRATANRIANSLQKVLALIRDTSCDPRSNILWRLFS